MPASTSVAVAQANQNHQQIDMYGNIIAPPAGLCQRGLSRSSARVIDSPRCASPGLSQSQTVQNVTVAVEEDLTEEELLLGPTVVYGFSLTDKMWCESRCAEPLVSLTHRTTLCSGVQRRAGPGRGVE